MVLIVFLVSEEWCRQMNKQILFRSHSDEGQYTDIVKANDVHQCSRRVALPANYISLVLGHLRSDDIYHQVSFTALNNHFVIARQLQKSPAVVLR